jgi:two-component system cell cycle sensor histidine kinase/response regulator CckA
VIERGDVPAAAADPAFEHRPEDLHDRVRRLEAENAFLVAAQAVAKVGSWETDIATLAVTWSAETHRIFDTDPTTFRATHAAFLERVHPDDRAAVAEAFVRSQGVPGACAIQHRLLMPDGRIKHVQERWHTFVDGAGRADRAIGTCQDVSEQQLARDAIRVRSHMLDSIGEAVIATDLEGRITYANRFAERLYGWEAGEMTGRNIAAVTVPEENLPQALEIMDGLRAGQSWRGEFKVRRRDGSFFPALVLNAPILDAQGLLTGVIGVSTDLTEQKQSEEDHKELADRLLQAQKMEAVGRLAGGVAHDFNNSLGVIMGYAELLIRHAAEPQRARLEQIMKAAKRSAEMTRQLLAFSRKQVIQPGTLDLNLLLSDLQGMLGRLIGEDIALENVAAAPLGQVHVDKGQLEQAIVNLCLNARDAMPDGGHLRIETSNTDVGADSRGELAPGPYVTLTVSDNGVGMDDVTLSKVFEPFFTTKETGKGTGLGLAMVYGVVKQAGGHVWASSIPGRGSTFTLSLPRVDVGETSTPAAIAAEPAPLDQAEARETILVVEDEGQLLEFSCEVLTEQGYTVLAAGSASEAMAVASGHAGPVHLLLTDVVMPVMNGRNLAEALLRARPQLTVLFMSGYTDDILTRRGVLAEGAALLEKPFSGRTLAVRVRKMLDGGTIARPGLAAKAQT